MLAAFISGIATALTPCTIVIIPIFLYRYGIWGNKDKKILVKDILLVLFGFIASFLLIGLVFDRISNSDFYNLVRLLLGTAFIVMGVLQFAGKFSINILNKVSNSFVLGFLLPWTLSFSPCVLPIFSAFLALNVSEGVIYIKLLIYALGILTPGVLVAILGNKLFEFMKRSGKAFSLIEKLSGIIIIVSGVYLNFQILDIRQMDIIIAGITFALVLLVSGYIVFVIQKKTTLSSVLMFLSIFILWIIFIFNCYKETLPINSSNQKVLAKEVVSCGLQEEPCEICKRCATLFSIAAILGGSGYLLSQSNIRSKFPKIRIE